MNDRFQGYLRNDTQYSQYAPVVSNSNSGHDVFLGKSHDNPAISMFKSDSGSAAIADGFYGTVDKHDDALSYRFV